jgi:AcrR family transcriptional regulator
MEPGASATTSRRSELLLAARHELSTSAYEQVGLRQVAARAGMDTAKLMREFGSKEALLTEALDEALAGLTPLSDAWPEEIGAELTGKAPRGLTEPFHILALSAPSPAVGAIVAPRIPVLTGRLAASIGPGPDSDVRAALAATVIFGVILTRDVIGLEPPGGRDICTSRVVELLASLRRRPDEAAPRSRARPEPGPRPFGVAETKAAILKAADSAFSQLGYEHASVRRIATEAQVDPALVIRYYGSKEALFREVLRLHFAGPSQPNPDFETASAAFADPRTAGSPLDIVLRSAASPTARQVLKDDIQARFIVPVAEASGDDMAEVRALMRSALFMGASFCNSILRIPAIEADRARAIEQLTGLFRLARTSRHG